jgi:dinuclear metal center YbgI/SA1388 family protein
MTVPLQEIIKLLNEHYPFSWAVSGDRTGLEIGHPQTPVARVLVALEAAPAVVAEARQKGAQLLITHHPLLYQPLKEVREDRPVGGLMAQIIRAGLALIACHTNLDVAPGGLNDYLGQLLGLEDVEVLSPTGADPWCKLTVFTPLGYEDPVRQALAQEGLGVIGRYSHCSFAGRGEGTYLPLEGARPFRGEVARLSRAAESRLEMMAPESRLAAALARLKEVHPYEEVAYDLYPLKGQGLPLGLGRVGRWSAPRSFPQIVSQIKEVLGVSHIRVWGRPPAEVERVAVCGGSGGELIGAAREKGAQVYLTGEVRHHQAPPEMEDFAVLEVGHYASEAVFMKPWAAELQARFQNAGWQVEVEAAAHSAAPYHYV